MAVLDPINYLDMESLRRELVDLVEERLDEVEWLNWARSDSEFHFARSQFLIFDTSYRIEIPDELASAVAGMSAGSIFYHFVEARRRLPEGLDDLRFWLMGFGDTYTDLCMRLASVDPYFSTLTELRRQLTDIFTAYFEEASQ
jgi:hypothetical protein